MNTPLVLAADGVPALPAGGVAAPARPGLGQCLLLALLLHLWLVALVGTTPGSGEPGDGAPLPPLHVRLQGPGPDDSAGRASQPLPDTGPLGRAPEPRFGGTVREAPPRPSPEPGAAQLGVWSPQPSPDLLRPRVPAPAAPTDPAPAPAAPPQLMREDRRPAPPAPAPAPTPQRPAPIEPAAPAATEAAAGPSTAPRLAPQDTAEAPVLQRTEQTERDIAQSARQPGSTSVPQPAPAPAPRRDPPLPSLPERRAEPPAPPAEARPAEVPPPAPLPASALPLAPPLPSTPALATAADTAPPAPPEAARVQAAPVVPPPPVPAAAPDSVPPPPSAVPPPAAPVQPRTPAAPTLVRPSIDASALPRAEPVDVRAPAVRAPEAPAAVAAPARDSLLPVPPPPSLPGGAPAAGARLGADRATAPSAAASAPPLRLELPSARAPVPGLVNPRVLNLVPPPPERKSPLAEGIEKAGKADCRKAYAGMGVLAVVPLAADALRDGGCRW